MKNKLTGLLLIIFFTFFTVNIVKGQIPSAKMVTFDDLQYLIDNEDFILKNDFSSEPGNKCVTKSELISALYVDDTGGLNSRAFNQLVPRFDVVPIEGGIKAFMMTAYHDNIENQIDKGSPTIHYLHDGNFVLPVVGDRIYNEDGTVKTIVDAQPYYGAQRYPDLYNDEVNIRIGPTGYVEWVGWVKDRTLAATNLAYTNTWIQEFTLSWNGNSRYYNPRYFVEFRRLQPEVPYWETWTEITNGQDNDGFNYEVQVKPMLKSEWRIRTVATTARLHERFDKVSDVLVVQPMYSYSNWMTSTEQGGVACAPPIGESVDFFTLNNPVQVGDQLYTDVLCTVKFTYPHVYWWMSNGATYSWRIGNDGIITAIGNCQ